jgi:methylenetetrahydrofolate dehydrogenase (NADP+)/methenyltetrahydrofolate cyclohydrolase
MATILSGTEVAEALDGRTAADVCALKETGITATLAIVRVGERKDDVSYERGATQRAEKVGVCLRNIVLPQDIGQDGLTSVIEALNADASVHGVLLFRPLPAHIDEDVVRNTLIPAKDVDGITDLSLAGVFADSATGYAPCTPSAVMEVLGHYGYGLQGRRAVVIGRSLVVGKPVAMMLLKGHATVTLAHSRTEGLTDIVRAADIVVACAGRAQMIDAGYLSEGQVVIDVGINVTQEGLLVGDVDFDEALPVVKAVTPVPKGVGAVTTSVLMRHVVEAALKTLPAGSS